MAQFGSSGKVIRRTSKTLPTSPVSGTPPTSSQGIGRGADDHISKYCCFLKSRTAEANGSGFIVEFEGLQSGELLALTWEKREKPGELQTNYALITSHDTIPGLSLSALEGWTVSCQGIENGNEQILSDLVCGVVSCCGPESLFSIRHGDARMFLAHPNLSCQVELNITILFLNSTFERLSGQGVQESTGDCAVFPPMVSVQKYLDLKVFSQEHNKIISDLSSVNGRETSDSRLTHSVHVYYCNGPMSSQKTAVSLSEQQDVSEHTGVISQDIRDFEKFQKVYYRESSNTTALVGRCYGSPVVYHNTDTNEFSVIGVHVGETDQTGEYVAVTLYGILQILRGGLVPVLAVLQYFETPRLWPSRWAYLVTPHIEQMRQMESGYVFEVLHYFLKDRFGTQLITLAVDLVDADNEASLELLCALFKHLEAADDFNKVSYDECHDREIEDDIKELCDCLLNLLECAAREPKQKKIVPAVEVNPQAEGVSLRDRMSLVEKCVTFYKRLLDIKYAGITEKALCTSRSHELVNNIHHDPRYRSTKFDISDICVKISDSLKNQGEKVMQGAAMRNPAVKSGMRKQSLRSDKPPAKKRKRPASESSALDECNHSATLEGLGEESQVKLAGSNKIEVKRQDVHQDVQTETVETKNWHVQTETVERKDEHVQTEIVEIKDTRVLTETEKIKDCHVQAEPVENKDAHMQKGTEETKDRHVQTKPEKIHYWEGEGIKGTRAEQQAHIRGTEVIAQKTFTLTQEEVDLNFEGYGFKLHVPENSLPAEVSEAQLNVRVSLSGPFQIPSNSELLSAVYWIFSPHKFEKPITVKIQHCAALSSDKQCSKLTFVRTKCSQKELPYTFKELVGGVFEPKNSYGSLSLSHFSGLAIGVKEAACQTGQEEIVEQCCAQLYSTCKLVNEWKVDFVVTKDLDACRTVLKKEYCHAQKHFSFTFGFKNDFVSLEIPKEGLQLDKWKVTPLYNPQITRQEVNNFSSGKNIPKCELLLVLDQDTPPAPLHHLFDLVGAGVRSYFLLHINPVSESSLSASTPKRDSVAAEESTVKVPQIELTIDDHLEVTDYLLDFGQTHIHNLGLALGLYHRHLKSMSGSETFLDDMIDAWLQREDQVLKRGMPTWENLVKALRDRRVNQIGVAEKIETEKLQIVSTI